MVQQITISPTNFSARIFSLRFQNKKSSVFNLQTESRLECKCLSKGYTFQIFLQLYVQIVKMFPICAVNSTRTSRMQWKSHFWRSSLLLGNKSLPHLNPVQKWKFLRIFLLIYSFRLACQQKICLHQNYNVLLLDTARFWRSIIPYVKLKKEVSINGCNIWKHQGKHCWACTFLVYLAFSGV